MELEGLNAAQLAAVKHGEGPALVVAGAGTGKTAVITRRIAHLIAQNQAQPSQILALTFTEKAAREMAERLHSLIGWESFQVPVLTFNAFGAELLGRFAPHIGRSVSGGLINDLQKSLLMYQHFSRLKLSYYGPQDNIYEFIEGVVEFINRLQNNNISPHDYSEYVGRLAEDSGETHPRDIAEQMDLAQLYQLYDDLKAETGTFDYNDQIEIPLRILQQKAHLAQRLNKQYRYILVDEYQDTNTLQDRLLRAFIQKNGNIFAVGDDDQAIYGFRGAQIDNILSFVDHYEQVTPIVLTQNYRSCQAILDGAYRLIQHNNPDRLEAKLGLDKHLTSALNNNSQISFQPYALIGEEQAGILDSIEERIKGGEPASSIAVLAPTHSALSPIARGLRLRNLPFALSTNANIFEQPELNQLWYLLNWVGNRATQDAIAHVLLSPWFDWTSEEVRALVSHNHADLDDFESTLRSSSEGHAVAAVKKIDQWRMQSVQSGVSALVYNLVFDTTVADELIKSATKSGRIARVFEDLHLLLGHMQDYETVSTDKTLLGYLATFPKPPSIEASEPIGESEGVQLLTVHASKGLEFETVYLIGCTQRAWSPRTRIERYEVPPELVDREQLPPDHEQRRLMYVAVTRAKNSLMISAATETAARTRQSISHFLHELIPDGIADSTACTSSNKLHESLRKIQRYYPLQDNIEQKLPFETEKGWLELGVNDLGSYDFCPYDFYIQKVLGISQPFGPQLAFGMALHSAIQRYYQSQLRGENTTEAELKLIIDQNWSDRGYASKDLANQAKSLAYRALHNFCIRSQPRNIKILGTELPIKLELPEAQLRLTGRIDAFFETPEGVELRDFKTGRGQTDAEKLSVKAKTSFQLRTYALAYEALVGKTPAQVTLDYVVTDTVGSAQLSSTILANHRKKLASLADRIRSRDFKPQNTTMHTCASIKYYGTEDDLEDLRKPEGSNV